MVSIAYLSLQSIAVGCSLCWELLWSLFFLKYFFVSDAYEEDMSHSGSESHSLQGSDEDGFLEDDDDNNNMVMIDHKTTGNTQILSCCTTHASMLC